MRCLILIFITCILVELLWSTVVGKVAIQQASYQKSMALIIQGA